MKFFNRYISHKIVLNILLGLAVAGMFSVLFSVNRINRLLNTELAFNKDSVYTIKTVESKAILPDSLIFSSTIPGFKVSNNVEVKTEYKKGFTKIARQFISENYFDFFNYEKLVEKPELLMDHGKAQPVYINESAVKELGIYSIDDAPGTRFVTKDDLELIVCGVINNFQNLDLYLDNQAVIYQLSSEHLANAYFKNSSLDSTGLVVSSAISFQQRIQNQYKIWEDIIYSTFLFINAIILLICLGYIGNKYALKKERELYKILGIGIHVLTLVISKTYVYLLAIIGFVAGPLALLIQKLWLGVYANRIHFGLIDLFIILSMALLTVYLVCCPKKKLEKQLRGKSIQLDSI